MCVAGCIKVLLPHRLVFSFRGSALIATARESEADLEDTLEVATGWFENFIEDNRIELEQLTRWYTVACCALGAEIVLWLLGAPEYPGMTMVAAPKPAAAPAPPPLPKTPPPGFGILEKRGSTPDDRK